jgi:hypothetical protein
MPAIKLSSLSITADAITESRVVFTPKPFDPRKPLTVADVHGGDTFVWDGEKGPVKVVTVEVQPAGCRGKVHVNRSGCYDMGTPVRLVGKR